MKRLLLFLMFSLIAFGQITIQTQTTNTVSTTAGSLVCLSKSSIPATLIGVSISCSLDGTNVFTTTIVVPIGPGGIVGSFNPCALSGTTCTATGDVVTWQLTQATATPGVAYQFAGTHNGVQVTGSPATGIF